jgi:putative ABC transport system permease protein
MFKNYLLLALRTFTKNGTFTVINLLGLSSGLAITMLIIQYVRFELSYENMHHNADKIVRLTTDYMDGQSVSEQDCETNPPIGPLILREMPEVINFTRAYPIGEPNLTVQVEQQQYVLEKVFAVDSSFFSIFSYHLISGSTQDIFKHPGETVITETIAKRLFNSKDVLGKTIEMPNGNNKNLFKIVGVAADSPHNTHLKFDMIFSFSSMYAEPVINGEFEDNWDGNNTLTYIQLADGAQYNSFLNSLDNFNKRLLDSKKLKNEKLAAQKIGDIHLYSHKIFEVEPNGSATVVFFLLGVAILVIVSAFVNYINLATSKALDRAKEVGLRKVVGSTPGQLRWQFMTETILINVFAGILALDIIVLAKTAFLSIAGLQADFGMFNDPFFWLILLGFLVVSVLFSGIYPAIVLSSFEPVTVLKGNFSRSLKGASLRKGLVVFQFTVTIVLLVQTFTVNQQLAYMRAFDLGVDVNQILVVKAPVERKYQENFQQFKNEVLAIPNVHSFSLSTAVPGQSTSQFSTTTGVNLSGNTDPHNYNFYFNAIDAAYIPSMGLQVIAGENFIPGTNNDTHELVVNEEAIRLWGLQDAKAAIGKELSFWGDKWTIRGVIKNYYQESAKYAQIPIIHRYYDKAFEENGSIKFSGGNPKDQLAAIETIYKNNFRGASFNYFFQNAEYDKQFKADERFQKVFGILTVFAILIACLGLFGLASFSVAKRTKEIGIRKVIGASTSNLLITLSKDFIKTVLTSMVIGIPVTYFIIKTWLNDFANRIEISWWLFALPVLVVMILVLLSIAGKTLKTAWMNPVKCLRSE